LGKDAHDGERTNAFTHSFWIASLRNLAIKLSDPMSWALSIGVRHEDDANGQGSTDPTKKKLSDMDLHNNRVGYDNASTVSLYRSRVGMRRAATKANAYNATNRSIDGASTRQLVYVVADNHNPAASTIHAGSPSLCQQ
jgi:hypothetical protein